MSLQLLFKGIFWYRQKYVILGKHTKKEGENSLFTGIFSHFLHHFVNASPGTRTLDTLIKSQVQSRRFCQVWTFCFRILTPKTEPEAVIFVIAFRKKLRKIFNKMSEADSIVS